MRHVPVLLNEVIEGLALTPGDVAIDCTLGDGGHAEAMTQQIGPTGRLLGLDADPESLLRAKHNLNDVADRCIFVRENFEHLREVAVANNVSAADGILMDLGWSSPQFAERHRGFSFQNPDEPLDMRYNPRLDCEHVADEPPTAADGKAIYGRCTAAEVLNVAPQERLEEIFRVYGEERLSVEIADAIVAARATYVLETVNDLVTIILDVYRKKLKTDKEVPWVGGLHPATKVFQALRIAVNDELGVLERAMPQALDLLAPGGRLAIITFHSLEDRIVKHFYKSQEKNGFTIITKKPLIPSDDEQEQNPRARSAKLRIIQKHI